MPALEPLYRLIKINHRELSKEKIFILEAELFSRICTKIKDYFREQYKDYFYLMKFTTEMENTMLDSNYMRFLINDIISTKEYTLSGIAYYTETPEDVILEVISGYNKRPSAIFLQKIIDLHRAVRPDLYEAVLKEITLQYSNNA